MKIMILAVALVLAGCGMSDEELVAATDRCQAKGMDAQITSRLWSARAFEVACMPRVKWHELVQPEVLVTNQPLPEPAECQAIPLDGSRENLRRRIECNGIPIIDWCDIPAGDREMLERNEIGSGERKCP